RRATSLGLALLTALAACSAGGGADGDADGDAGGPAQERQASTTRPPADPGPVAGDLDAAELGQPFLGELTFELPVDCTVGVAEHREESDGTEIELRYHLTFTAEGDDALVAIDDIEVERVVMGGTETPAALVDTVVFERPALLVDRDGQAVGVRGADELVERLPIDPAARPFVRQGLAVDVTEKVWNVGFGLWAAWRTIDAPETTAVVEEGTDRERQVTVTSVGTDGGLAA